MPDREPLAGGCQCGAVRYRVAQVPKHVVHCHCSQCRRSAGAPVWFASSDHGKRGFCAACGTQLLFVSTRYPAMVDVAAASLDHPERLVPQRHTFAPHRLPWFEMADDLPRHVGDSTSPRVG